jgi:hypothetical protein
MKNEQDPFPRDERGCLIKSGLLYERAYRLLGVSVANQSIALYDNATHRTAVLWPGYGKWPFATEPKGKWEDIKLEFGISTDRTRIAINTPVRLEYHGSVKEPQGGVMNGIRVICGKTFKALLGMGSLHMWPNGAGSDQSFLYFYLYPDGETLLGVKNLERINCAL